jgi:hypothetical protein
MYAYPSYRRSRYREVAPLIATWLGEIDSLFDQSARETGGARHVRFAADTNCNLSVLEVRLSRGAVDSFAKTVRELHERGYRRADRKYLVWVDADDYCGISESMVDDRPGLRNASNGNPAVDGLVARVDRPCWGKLGTDISFEAHELLHTLGAVQESAPNATRFGHCSDQWDTMCYDDGGLGQLGLRDVCPLWHADYFDCDHDDYFNTNPAPGSYLATHWNVASSEFLTSGPP